MKPELFIGMAIKAWDLQISRVNRFLDLLGDDKFDNEIAPGKNRISYLLGHLIAVNDRMIELFDMGERSHAHLDEIFVRNPDRPGQPGPDAARLRQLWKDQNEQLSSIFAKMTAEQWFGRHTAISDEDFAREPTRNKLNVLLNRTSHVAWHLGQFALVKAGFE